MSIGKDTTFISYFKLFRQTYPFLFRFPINHDTTFRGISLSSTFFKQNRFVINPQALIFVMPVLWDEVEK